MERLSFPYYTYPGIPCCGYHDIERYNPELLRLYDSLENIISDPPSVFHLTIGAAMEEFQKLAYDKKCDYQWQQLFPFHIRNFLMNGNKYKKKVIHFIVSPNEHFSSAIDDIPFFVMRTPEFEWEIMGKSYISKKYNYEVHIFCTMIPTIDMRNETILKSFEGHSSQSVLQAVQNFRQTEYDRIFVGMFNSVLEKAIESVTINNGVVTCFSFAVFNQQSDRSVIRDYQMFPEIKRIFDSHPHSFLAEWIFRKHQYTLKLAKYAHHTKRVGYKKNDFAGVSYIFPTKEMQDGCQLMIKDDGKMFVDMIESSELLPKDTQSRKQIYLDKFCEKFIDDSRDISLDEMNDVYHLSSMSEKEIRNKCIVIIRQYFNKKNVKIFVSNMSWMAHLIRKYSINSEMILELYFSVISGSNTLHSLIPEISPSDVTEMSNIKHFGLLELLAMSIMTGKSLVFVIAGKEVKIRHPKINESNEINVYDTFDMVTHSYLFKFMNTF